MEELMSAEEFWIKEAQAQAYSDDLTQLAAGKEVHCSSDLRSLYPYTDEKGILRVGGRRHMLQFRIKLNILLYFLRSMTLFP